MFEDVCHDDEEASTRADDAVLKNGDIADTYMICQRAEYDIVLLR